jgi:purF: amidophosphoribosyltransferase
MLLKKLTALFRSCWWIKTASIAQEISTAELLLLSAKKKMHFVWRLNVSHTKTSATMIIKNSGRVRLR